MSIATSSSVEKALPNAALIRTRTWPSCIFHFRLDFVFLCFFLKNAFPLQMLFGVWMILTSVIMAFSTNFISASCVKLNKFNFVIFFKKVAEFLLVTITIVFDRMGVSLCRTYF